jgi:hypothetical protein
MGDDSTRTELSPPPKTSHRRAVAATVVVLVAWACVTMNADTLAPWIGSIAGSVEHVLGLDEAIGEDD